MSCCSSNDPKKTSDSSCACGCGSGGIGKRLVFLAILLLVIAAFIVFSKSKEKPTVPEAPATAVQTLQTQATPPAAQP